MRSVTLSPRAFLEPANLLSLSRIPLAGLVWLAPGEPLYLLGLTSLAAITDHLDGRVACRARAERPDPTAEQGRNIGAWLDPVCDKVFLLSILLAVAVVWRPPLHLLALIATRELIQIAAVGVFLAMKGRSVVRYDYRASPVGKLTTVAQVVALAAILFGLTGMITPLAWGVAVIGLCAAVQYVARGVRGWGARST